MVTPMNNYLLDGKEQNYADILAIKSDDELKAIINDGAAYDAAFVDIARNELMERTLGNRVQRTAEEVVAAKEEHEEQERQLEDEREPELPLGSHAKRYRTLFVVFFVLACVLSLVLYNLDWLSFDVPYEVFQTASRWISFATYALNVVAFGMLIPLSSNRQIRNGVIVLVSILTLLSLVQLFIGSGNWVFDICSMAYSLYFDPLAVIYAWSIVIRNNDWRKSEKSWTGMLVLLFCSNILMAIPSFYEMEVCVPGSYGQFYTLYGGNLIEYRILLHTCLLLEMIVCIKLAFSSAFTENLRESPLEKRQYFPFNKYVLAGVIALVIRFAANAALAYYVSTL